MSHCPFPVWRSWQNFALKCSKLLQNNHTLKRCDRLVDQYPDSDSEVWMAWPQPDRLPIAKILGSTNLYPRLVLIQSRSPKKSIQYISQPAERPQYLPLLRATWLWLMKSSNDERPGPFPTYRRSCEEQTLKATNMNKGNKFEWPSPWRRLK